MSNDLINKLAIGTVQFGLNYGISNQSGKTPSDEVSRILGLCQEVGIDTIDTAFGYGQCEKVLGQNDLSSFKVITKFMPDGNGVPVLADQIEQSLLNLNIDSLYGILAHRPLDVVSEPSQWEYLCQLKKNGLVQKIGFSFNTIEEFDGIIKQNLIPDLVQAPFNYFDNRFESILKVLKQKHECEIHTRSAFLQGLFFLDINSLESFFDEVKPAILQLQKQDSSLPGLLLKYCLQKPFIDKVVFGVNNKNQLLENIESIEENGDLPENKAVINDAILSPSKWPKKA